MAKAIKSRIASLENKLSSLRSKHANWYPADANTMAAWAKQITELRNKIEYASQPAVKLQVRFMQKTISEINQVLLDDTKLTENERRILMEKRGMYQTLLNTIIPTEEEVAGWERELDYQTNYPQGEIMKHY